MSVERLVRDRYVKDVKLDTGRRGELGVLHLDEKPPVQYRSSKTGGGMMWFLDSSKCTGCKQCMMACSLAKTGTYTLTESRIYVKKREAKGWSLPMVCEHCVEAPCANICPVYAITRDPDTGIVDINLETCIGCRLCRDVCPWGKETIAIRNVEGFKGLKAVKCDLCGGDPACAQVCIPGVINWVKADSKSIELKRRLSRERAQESVAMDVEGCL